MNKKVLPFLALLALVATLAGCGGGQDSEESAAATDGADSATMSAPRDEAEQAVEQAADSTEEAAETAMEEIEGAGEQVRQMADEAGEQTREMVDEASEQMDHMAHEAGERAERAMADASDAMSMSEGDSAAADSGDPCVVNVQVGDSIAYNVDSISVPSSCESVTINLNHTGSLPVEAMGHNWVLVPSDAVQEVGMAGMSAGLENDYLPEDDRIVAATDMIGGGQSASVSFSLDDLQDGVAYEFVCTFPGHWTAMRGPFTVE